jgi:peptide/nickel transport system permease protein
MAQQILLRVARLIGTLLAVSLLTFSMTLLLPGDPIDAILPPTAERDPETIARIRDELDLDDPLLTRYATWLGDVLQGDLGRSYIDDRPVAATIAERLPVTAQLASMAVGLAVLAAVPIGVLGAYRQGRTSDQISSAVVQVALSIPNFITGVLLIWLFTVQINLLPSTGWNRIGSDGVIENLRTAILPASALALPQMAIFSRLIRSDMIATLQEDFILSAKAKGLRDGYILFRHALRPSSLSLITIIGINIGALLGGTVVIETLFALPGLGSRLINAINQRDILVIQGITMFIATAYVVINTAVDLLYLVVDPRTRRS